MFRLSLLTNYFFNSLPLGIGHWCEFLSHYLMILVNHKIADSLLNIIYIFPKHYLTFVRIIPPERQAVTRYASPYKTDNNETTTR